MSAKGIFLTKAAPKDYQGNNHMNRSLAAVIIMFATAFAVAGNFKVNLTANHAGALANYPAFFYFDSASLIAAGGMNSSCQDLNITNEAGTTALSFYLVNGTCNQPYTTVWVKIPSFTNGTVIKVNYGNQSMSSIASAVNTFSNSYSAVFLDRYPMAGGNLSVFDVYAGIAANYSWYLDSTYSAPQMVSPNRNATISTGTVPRWTYWNRATPITPDVYANGFTVSGFIMQPTAKITTSGTILCGHVDDDTVPFVCAKTTLSAGSYYLQYQQRGAANVLVSNTTPIKLYNDTWTYFSFNLWPNQSVTVFNGTNWYNLSAAAAGAFGKTLDTWTMWGDWQGVGYNEYGSMALDRLTVSTGGRTPAWLIAEASQNFTLITPPANIYGIIYAQSFGANVVYPAATLRTYYPNGTLIASTVSDAYGQFFINATQGTTVLFMSSTSGRAFITTVNVTTAPGNTLLYPVMFPTYPILYGYAKYQNGTNFSNAIVATYNASTNAAFDAMVTGASGYYSVYSGRGNMSLRAATPSGSREFWYDAYVDVQADTYGEIVLNPIVPYYSISGLSYYENGTEAWASYYLVNNSGGTLVGYANATPGVNSYYFPVQTGNYTLIAAVTTPNGVYSGSQILRVTDNTVMNIWVYESRPILTLMPSNNTYIPAEGLYFFRVLGDFTHADLSDYDAFGFVLDNGTNIIYNVTRAKDPSPYFEASLVHWYALAFQNNILNGYPVINWSVISPYIANATFTNYSTQGVYVNLTGKPAGLWHAHAWWHKVSTNYTDGVETTYHIINSGGSAVTPSPAPAEGEFSNAVDAWIIAFILSLGVGIALSRYSVEGGAIGFILAMFIFTGMGWLPVYVPIVAGLFMAGVYAVIGEKGKK